MGKNRNWICGRMVALAMSVLALGGLARAQTWTSQHARALILPGGGSDVANVLTLQLAGNTSGGISWTLPGANAAGVLANGGSGTLGWTNTPSLASLSLTNTTNQLELGGASHLLTISSPAISASSQTYTLPDAGAAADLSLIIGTVNPGGVVYSSTATAQASSSAGSSGQFLTSGGTGAPTWGSAMTLVSGVSNGNINDGTSANPMGMGPVSNASVGVTNENEMLVTRAGTIKNLYAAVPTTPASGKDYEILILKNGSASTVAADITNGSTSASDLTHTLTVAAGDFISVKMTHATAAATNGKAIWSFEITYP